MATLNCDMGEAFGLYRMGDDEGLMPLIDIANVAFLPKPFSVQELAEAVRRALAGK